MEWSRRASRGAHLILHPETLPPLSSLNNVSIVLCDQKLQKWGGDILNSPLEKNKLEKLQQDSGRKK